jgi:hypothetical protein
MKKAARVFEQVVYGLAAQSASRPPLAETPSRYVPEAGPPTPREQDPHIAIFCERAFRSSDFPQVRQECVQELV